MRLGTAEFYRVIEEIDGVADSLIVHLEQEGGNGELILFLVVEPGHTIDEVAPVVVRRVRTDLSLGTYRKPSWRYPRFPATAPARNWSYP